NGTYGGVGGKGAKAKTLAPRPTRFDNIWHKSLHRLFFLLGMKIFGKKCLRNIFFSNFAPSMLKRYFSFNTTII
ncbi:MAG: hypothetical protein IJ613_06215, partial [Muribaculaceae bacterium]|nr:hypothetical protein [Muribaculaceae bacterium]